VVDTLRVVRLKRRTPSRASSPATVALRADRDMPMVVAAALKPPCLATANTASNSTSPLLRMIDCPDFRNSSWCFGWLLKSTPLP
jgi:hypothetical protein